MPVIKCKCCGGDITISADKTFGTCEYCGSTMTLPKVDDDQRAAAFNRGNHFRRQGEFDKALAVYERIVAEDDTDAEAHWCCALCRFGIEYVEDPATYEWLPTCHRASFDSFLEDVDYLAAVEHSAGITKRQYQKDAAKIAEVQRGILATSQNEAPFDVFICYKESEENGDRTRDSILAQEIYYQLTEQGRRVFFSRITLEDKAGTEYEPYIFAALNSARVMVAVGTTPEHFNAVWVRNEWSRFLALMRKDRKKLLLPCYRDMDPYDLPEQLSVLQSYDMGKIGFMQDLTRGINKVLDAEKKPETVVIQQAAAGGTTAAAQVQRGNMALEDHQWDKADSFFEEALNLNPQCAEAYLGKLLARDKKPGFASWLTMQKEKYQAATTEKLEACPEDTDHIRKLVNECKVPGYLNAGTIEKEYRYERLYDSTCSCRRSQKEKQLSELKADRLFSRAQQFASGETEKLIKDGLAQLTAELDNRIAIAEKLNAEHAADVRKKYEEHMNAADEKVRQLSADAEARRESDYQAAVTLKNTAESAEQYQKAADAFDALVQYQDSEALAVACRKEIKRIAEEERLERERQQEEKRRKEQQAEEERRRKEQQEQEERERQEEARRQEEAKRREEKRKEEERQAAIRKKEAERAAKKRSIIKAIVAATVIICIAAVIVGIKVIIPNKRYNSAVALMESEDYSGAISAFEALNGYKDSTNQITECEYLDACALMDNGDYDSAISAFEALGGYQDSADQIMECRYLKAVGMMENGDYGAAITVFTALDGYKDCADQIEACRTGIKDSNYEAASTLIDNGDYEAAITALEALDGYKDSEELAISIMKEHPEAIPAGYTLQLGSYEQDNDESNGTEPVEWIILENDGDWVLVISRYALDCQPYNTENTDVTWETCTLRSWLNLDFISAAFTTEEADRILTATVSADKNPTYSTDAGNDTQDQVFLLSIDEAEKYFATDDARMCVPTAYAVAQGVLTSEESYVDGEATTTWTVRTPGKAADHFAYVYDTGSVCTKGANVDASNAAVRPAMWISLDESMIETVTAQKSDSDNSLYPGFDVTEISETAVYSYGYASAVRISNVDENSEAAEKGIQDDDLILSVNGTAVKTIDDYNQIISSCSAGDRVELEVSNIETEDSRNITITLMDTAETSDIETSDTSDADSASQIFNPFSQFDNSLYPGFDVTEISETAVYSFGLASAVQISNVDENSEAAENGIQYGDLILSVNGTAVKTIDDYNQVISNCSAGDQVELEVSNRETGDSQNITITLMDTAETSDTETSDTSDDGASENESNTINPFSGYGFGN